MKIRKYFAADMRQALNMARREQGPDVVILGNRKVLGGIELMAAEDYDESLYISEDNPGRQQTAISGQGPSASLPPEEEFAASRAMPDTVEDNPPDESLKTAGNGMLWSRDPALELMREEINSLRQLLEQQVSGLAWGDVGRRHPLWAVLLRRFGQMGISASLAREIVEQVPEQYGIEQAWRTALALLSYRLPVQREELLNKHAIIAFAGASGSGKTTTIAKLAARYVLEHGNGNVVLATLDSYRVGGREQLRSYARILGVPLRSVNHADELNDMLIQCHGRKLILIDTAGLSPRDKLQRQQLQLLSNAGMPVSICLVLSAISQLPALNQTVDTYQGLHPQFCAVTKLDEAHTLGPLLSVVIQKKLKLAYQCAGQQVPEDIQHAQSATLIARAVAVMKQERAEEDDTAIEQYYGKYTAGHPLGEFNGKG